MKAQKVTVTIVIEGLSIDIVRGQLCEAATAIERGLVSGELVADDGDVVKWNTKTEDVKF